MEIVLRIQLLGVTPNGESAIQVLAIPGGTAMPQTPVLAPAPLQPPPNKWFDLLDKYLEWGRLHGGKRGGPWTPVHCTQNKFRLGWWGRKFEGLSPESIALEHIEARLAEIPGRTVKGKVKPSTTKTRRDYVRMLLTFRRWCHVRNLIRIPDPDPLAALRTPDGEPEVEYRALTVPEFKALMAVAPAKRKIYYAILALTGLRVGELRKILAGWVDLDAKCIFSPQLANKNRKKGYIPLSPTVHAIFAAAMEGKAPTERVFGLSQNFLNRKFHADLKEAGIPLHSPQGKAALHGMRDTASTVLQDELGFSLSAACDFLRHSDERITRKRYTSISIERKREAACALDGALMGAGLNPAPRIGAGMPPLVLERVKGIEPGAAPIVIVNLVSASGTGFPQNVPEVLGGFVGELCGVLLPLPPERAAEARAGLLAVARAYAAIPAGQSVKLTTQLLQVDQSAMPEAAVPAQAEGRAND